MDSRIDNFIIRQPDGTTRPSNSLVLGEGLTVTETAGGIPELRGSLNGAFFGAKLWTTDVVPVPNMVETTVPFNQESVDVGNFHSPAQPSRLTVPAGGAGVYLVVARGVFAGSPQALRITGFRKNGGDIAGLSRMDSAAPGTTVVATEILRLEAGDYLEMMMYHDGGVTTNAYTGFPYETSFMITRLGV
ncbi:MAG TPA: hypothetical protein VGB66_06400 [Longimicrobium sp.]|jgi:hypothetical protein